MKKFELNVVNFDNEDVIATSGEILVTVHTQVVQSYASNSANGGADSHNHLVSVMGEDNVDYKDVFAAYFELGECGGGWVGERNNRTHHNATPIVTSGDGIADEAQ